MFAVRQWPGNGADLDFRGVLEGCTAAIVAAAPIKGTLLKDGEGDMRHYNAREAFLESKEYVAAAKVLPFCRLWYVRVGQQRNVRPHITTSHSPASHPLLSKPRCVVEMAALLALKKPLIFACGKVAAVKTSDYNGLDRLRTDDDEPSPEIQHLGGNEASNDLMTRFIRLRTRGVSGRSDSGGGAVGRVEVLRGDEASSMLQNCSFLVNVATAQCAVPADKERELATIGPANFGQINRTVAAALGAGAVAAMANVYEVDAFNCGERGPLQALAEARVWRAFKVACSAGQLVVLVELWRVQTEAVVAYLAGEGGDGRGGWEPLWTASLNGRVEVVVWLVGEVGVYSGAVSPSDGASAVCVAAQNGHLEVVRALVGAGADLDLAKEDGVTPLFVAAQEGHLEVVRSLLGAGANVVQARAGGAAPLFVASQFGRLEVVRALVEAGAIVDQAADGGATPLYTSSQFGHLDVMRALVQAGAIVDPVADEGCTPLFMAAMDGHLEVVRALVGAGAIVDQATATLLFVAAKVGHLEVVRALVGAGASVDKAADDGGATPLIMAASNGHLEVVRALVGAGASVDKARDGGFTPLFSGQHHLQLYHACYNWSFLPARKNIRGTCTVHR